MPTRYLKPGICDSDAIDLCTPLAETLFYRLLVNVDDYGRLDARSAVVKARCFPLKESIPILEIEELLIILVRANLIHMYTTANGSKYLQLLKWDNVPRSKESKFPEFDETCIQLHTNVNGLHTNLPVTGTVNRKPELKPETGTVTVPPRKKRADPKSDDSELQAACKEAWVAYRDAYALRYAIDPVRNAKVNGQIKLFVGRLGAEDAPFVAAHYLTNNLAYYVQRGHGLDSLLADAEKLRTEWATGRSMTATRAKQIDQSQANFSAVGEALKIMEDRENERSQTKAA